MTKSTGAAKLRAARVEEKKSRVFEAVKQMEPVSCSAVARECGISKQLAYKILKEHADHYRLILVGRTDGARWCVYGSPASDSAQEAYERTAAKNARNRRRRERYAQIPMDRAFVHRIVPADQVKVHRPKRAVASVFELGLE